MKEKNLFYSWAAIIDFPDGTQEIDTAFISQQAVFNQFKSQYHHYPLGTTCRAVFTVKVHRHGNFGSGKLDSPIEF